MSGEGQRRAVKGEGTQGNIVEPRAVIREASAKIEVRRGDTEEGLAAVWIKPQRLDGDGEFHLTVERFGYALKILGINRADVFPEG